MTTRVLDRLEARKPATQWLLAYIAAGLTGAAAASSILVLVLVVFAA
jgi:hypothetical protein